MFGYTAQEAVGSPISILVPPDQAAEEPKILERLARGEKVDHSLTARMRKDGKRTEVSLTISPIRDAKGRILGASTIARDITERKLALEQIHLEQGRLQATLTSIGDGVIVTDVRGYVQFLNPVAEALTGWKQEEARGKTLEAVFDIVNETSRNRVENPAARALREGIVVGLANHTILIARDGSEVAIDDSAAPIRNENGAASGVILVFRDVTAARAVENVRARLSAIIEGSDDAIIGKDLEGRITSWNKGAESIFGYSQLEAIGRPITMLIPPDRLAEETDILRRLRRGKRVSHFETVRITKSRRKVPVSLTISPIYDGEGNVVGASKIARDISDRKKAERELKEAHRQLQRHAEALEQQVAERTSELKSSLEELETFSSGLSHDLKTPLRAITGYAQAVLQDYGPSLSGGALELVQRIEQISGRLARFVDDVLSYARILSGSIDLERVELNVLVPRVLEEYPHAKQVNAEVKIQEPLLPVQGHVALLTQVVANLVSNAVKFVSPGTRPELRIWSESRGGTVRLWVEDNGIGISKTEQQKVFELFARLTGSNTYEGTGVGLAVVQRAVRRMGGEVGVESEPGRGSRFWVDLRAPDNRSDEGRGGLLDISTSLSITRTDEAA
jgi:PAS domain S-box-containing protein